MSKANSEWRITLNKKIGEELQKDNPNFEEVFLKSARDLMNNYELEVTDDKGKRVYDFIELEFYFNDGDRHDDLYTHGKFEQKKGEGFYVHDKVGTHAGVDMVFGTSEYFGGILIRGVKLDNAFIGGPALSIGEICSKEIQNTKDREDAKEFFKDRVKIVSKVKKENAEIYKSIRQGLVYQKEDTSFYILKLYRFIRKDFLDKVSSQIEGTLHQKTMAIEFTEQSSRINEKKKEIIEMIKKKLKEDSTQDIKIGHEFCK